MATENLIVGAGLSGLSAAYYLQRYTAGSTKILEARSRAGGRILTADAVDLGATWCDANHTALIELLDDCGISTFAQYVEGESFFVQHLTHPPHIFSVPQDTAPTLRIAGGSSSLIDRLLEEVGSDIEFEQQVVCIADKGAVLEVETETNRYQSERVILALPPQLLSKSVAFKPPLPEKFEKTMLGTHTWMGTAIKFALSFEAPFWRSKALSGMLQSSAAPVLEMYDHVNDEDTKYHLMGFLNERMRERPEHERQSTVVEFLETYFGEEIRSFLSYQEMDWSAEEYTSTPADPLMLKPVYGNPIFSESCMGNKLYFCGSETAFSHGGYMDGAVSSGKRVARNLTR